jgi:hypothetical protein
MATRKTPKTSEPASSRVAIISAVTTPLSFFVFVVLVIEALIGTLIINLPSDQRVEVLRYMLLLAAGLVVVTSLIAHFNPDALYGKRSSTQEAVDRAQLNAPHITADEAIAKAERFAHLIAALIVIKTMFMARREYKASTGGTDAVMTDLRKRMYGYRAIFGNERVDDTDQTLSQLVGAVLNSRGTLDEIQKHVQAYLLVAEHGVIDSQGKIRVYKPETDMSLENPEGYEGFEELAKLAAEGARIERVLSSEGSENMYNSIVNVLWRNFESAILSGGRTLPGGVADTFLEAQFAHEWRNATKRPNNGDEPQPADGSATASAQKS